MKNIFFILATFILILEGGCKKENLGSFTEITITGMDLTMRPCSGGYYGKIGNETCRTLEIVSNTILTENLTFPKTFLIKYERPSGICYDEKDNTTKIKITEIRNK